MTRVKNTIIQIRDEKDLTTIRDITDIVRSLKIKKSLITHDTSWILDIAARTLTSEEKLFLTTGIKEIRISQNQLEVDTGTEWEIFIPYESELIYAGGIPIVRIMGSDLSANLKDKSRWTGFVSQNITSVIGFIAKRNGLILENINFSELGTWYQTGCDDWDFICEVLNEIVLPSGQRIPFWNLENRRLIIKEFDKQFLNN